VKDILEIVSTSLKESLLKLDQITNDLFLYMVIAMSRNNFKSIPTIGITSVDIAVMLYYSNMESGVVVVQLYYVLFPAFFSE